MTAKGDRMTYSSCNDYFDMRLVVRSRFEGTPRACAVDGCATDLEEAPSQWGRMPFCPEHGLRFHPSSGKFVFYNGHTLTERLQATLRNVIFETGFFERYVYGSPHKAERHRFCFETSEDALTWMSARPSRWRASWMHSPRFSPGNQ